MTAAALLGGGALCAAGAGFIALSLAMDRHWAQLHGRGTAPDARRRRWLRGAGTLGLLGALLACLSVWGAAQGWVAWAGVLTVAAIATALASTYAWRAIVRVGWVAAAAAMVLLAAGAVGS